MRFHRFRWAGLLLLALSITPAAANHFDFDTTDVNSSILIREVILTSRHWGEGDEIGLFTPAGLCAGGGVVREFPAGFPAWGDDALTDSTDGFEDGERLIFKGWDASAREEFNLPNVTALEGEAVWRANGWFVATLAEAGSHFAVRPTLARHRILCNRAEFIDDNGAVALADLDQIGILRENGSSAGVLLWDGALGRAIGYAYGDDPETGDVVEGFRNGEDFRFTFWTRRNNRETEANRIYFTRGDTTFYDDGASEVELESNTAAAGGIHELPASFTVSGPYPNPFNGIGSLRLTAPAAGRVVIALLDLNGRTLPEPRSFEVTAGDNSVSLDLTHLPAGEYLCRATYGGQSRIVRVVLLK